MTTQQPEQRRGQQTRAGEASIRAASPAPFLPSELHNKVVRAASARPSLDSLAFGEHLSRFPWEWFVTLTFRHQVGESSADRALWAFVAEARRQQGHMPGFFAVTEWQARRHVPHFHLLMLDVSGLRRLALKDWWERYGFARVMPYDPMRGANHYVGKYLFKEGGRVQTSRNLPKWRLDPDSPAVRAVARVFDLAGQSEQPTSSTAQAGIASRPLSAGATGK